MGLHGRTESGGALDPVDPRPPGGRGSLRVAVIKKAWKLPEWREHESETTSTRYPMHYAAFPATPSRFKIARPFIPTFSSLASRSLLSYQSFAHAFTRPDSYVIPQHELTYPKNLFAAKSCIDGCPFFFVSSLFS